VSHVAMMTVKAGNPVFADLKALVRAVKMIPGLKIEERTDYKWYGHHVGDYPMPTGMKASELGNNAKFVISVDRKHWPDGQEPYELAIIEDPNNKGCYLPLYDFWNGGQGLDQFLGTPVTGPSGLVLAPKLIQRYHMACDQLAAAEVGDEIEFKEQKDGSFVSIVKTQQRVGA
jgi:hypothetical protein